MNYSIFAFTFIFVDDGTDSEGHVDVDLEGSHTSEDDSGSQDLSSASSASSFSTGRSPRISGVSHSLPYRRVSKITSKTRTPPRRFIRHSARESGIIAQDGQMGSPLLSADGEVFLLLWICCMTKVNLIFSVFS